MTPAQTNSPTRPLPRDRALARELLGFFFPIHYQLGFELEDVLRQGMLSRQQATILWLIHSEGGATQSVPRKRVEALLSAWYEITSAPITKALRALHLPPLELVRIVEDPHSGREKRVHLTEAGKRVVEAMAREGHRFALELVRELGDQEIRAGLRFLHGVVHGLGRVREIRLVKRSEAPRVTAAAKRRRGPLTKAGQEV